MKAYLAEMLAWTFRRSWRYTVAGHLVNDSISNANSGLRIPSHTSDLTLPRNANVTQLYFSLWRKLR